jgi:hypothetical protein
VSDFEKTIVTPNQSLHAPLGDLVFEVPINRIPDGGRDLAEDNECLIVVYFGIENLREEKLNHGLTLPRPGSTIE